MNPNGRARRIASYWQAPHNSFSKLQHTGVLDEYLVDEIDAEARKLEREKFAAPPEGDPEDPAYHDELAEHEEARNAWLDARDLSFRELRWLKVWAVRLWDEHGHGRGEFRVPGWRNNVWDDTPVAA